MAIGSAMNAFGQTPPAASVLPEGPGKELVAARCIGCHDLGVVSSQRLTAEEWEKTLATMVDRGAAITDEEFDILQNYLVKAFPKTDPKQSRSSSPARSIGNSAAHGSKLPSADAPG